MFCVLLVDVVACCSLCVDCCLLFVFCWAVGVCCLMCVVCLLSLLLCVVFCIALLDVRCLCFVVDDVLFIACRCLLLLFNFLFVC